MVYSIHVTSGFTTLASQPCYPNQPCNFLLNPFLSWFTPSTSLRLHNLVTQKQQDKQTIVRMEQQLKNERESRISLENQMRDERKNHKSKEAAAARAAAMATAGRYVVFDNVNSEFASLTTCISVFPVYSWFSLGFNPGLSGRGACVLEQVS